MLAILLPAFIRLILRVAGEMCTSSRLMTMHATWRVPYEPADRAVYEPRGAETAEGYVERKFDMGKIRQLQ